MTDRYLLGGTVSPTLSGLTAIGRVETIAELTALAVSNLEEGTTVEVLGYYAAGDGAAFKARWVSASTDTADDKEVFAADAGGTGRWHRITEGYQAKSTREKPTGFSYVPGNIFDCQGPGLARHDIDLETEFRTTYSANMENPDQVDFESGKFVDPVNGSDGNGGGYNGPYATLDKAYASVGEGSIWLLPGTYTERFDVRDTDNLFSGAPRAIFIRALHGPGTVTFRAPGDQPGVMTWTSAGSGTYTATPSGSETVNHIVFLENGKEIDLDLQASAAAVANVEKGWFQDSGTKLITVRYRALSIETYKANLEIMYSRGVDLIVFGATTFIDGIDFRGDSTTQLLYNNGFRPVLYAKNSTWKYIEGPGIKPKGGICFTQRCRMERALEGDGINYDTDTVGPGTTSQGLEIDNVMSRNGVINSRPFTTSRNKQGSSAHSGHICRINGVYEGNYGQNIADTGTSTKTWCIGSVLGNPYSEIGGGESLAGFPSGWSEGTAYLDNVQSGGRAATYGWQIESGTAYMHNCLMSGTTDDIKETGTLNTYNPVNLP